MAANMTVKLGKNIYISNQKTTNILKFYCINLLMSFHNAINMAQLLIEVCVPWGVLAWVFHLSAINGGGKKAVVWIKNVTNRFMDLVLVTIGDNI